MQLRKAMLVLAIGAFTSSVKAYPYEYKKLYREDTGTVIDFLYDVHVAVPHMKTKHFLKLDYTAAFNKLYPTERAFLQFLQRLSKQGQSCDLIWESPSSDRFTCTPTEPCFIGLDNFFGVAKLPFIRFISADRNRNCGFNSLFSVMDKGVKRVGHNLTGCSFENPAPFPLTLEKKIEEVSGRALCQRYKVFRAKVIEDLKIYFGKAYHYKLPLEYKNDFHENDAFHALCDVEILSHILSSAAKKIVIYAGGWHCNRVSQFLERTGNYKVLNHERGTNQGSNRKQELPVSVLSRLGF